jgi:hypothetical protein
MVHNIGCSLGYANVEEPSTQPALALLQKKGTGKEHNSQPQVASKLQTYHHFQQQQQQQQQQQEKARQERQHRQQCFLT